MVNKLTIGIIGLNALTINQFKGVLAHELGHIRQKDPYFSYILNHAISNLFSWTSLNEPGAIIPLLLFPLYFPVRFFLRAYMSMLVGVSSWAIRRQEYTADRIAAQSYGNTLMWQSLISLSAANIAFSEYIPMMVDKIRNDFDRRDLFSQFVDLWDHLSEENRQGYYAKALCSFRTSYDAHPTYRDRRRFLEQYTKSDMDLDTRPALALLPNAFELGRELTVRIFQNK